MAVVGVFAETQVGDGDHGNFGCRAQQPADDVVLIERSGAGGILGFAIDDAENQIGFKALISAFGEPLGRHVD